MDRAVNPIVFLVAHVLVEFKEFAEKEQIGLGHESCPLEEHFVCQAELRTDFEDLRHSLLSEPVERNLSLRIELLPRHVAVLVVLVRFVLMYQFRQLVWGHGLLTVLLFLCWVFPTVHRYSHSPHRCYMRIV